MKCKIANKTKYDEKLLAFEIDQFHQIENFEVNDFYLTEGHFYKLNKKNFIVFDKIF